MSRLRPCLVALALSVLPVAAVAGAPDGAHILSCEADRRAPGCAEVLTQLFVCERAGAMAGCAELLATREAARSAAEAAAEAEAEAAAAAAAEEAAAAEAAAAAAAAAEAEAAEAEAAAAASCPVIDSRGWAAVLETGGEAPQLVVTGTVTLPTPGHAVSLEPGMSDRSARPVQTFVLTATPPDGPVVQVLMVYDLRGQMAAMAPVDGAAPYRGVRVTCGAVVLAEIDTVSLAD